MIFDLSDEDRHFIATALFERVKALTWIEMPNMLIDRERVALEIARLREEAKRCSSLADMISPNAKKEDEGK